MQAIVETLFDAVYLTSVIAIGVTMIVKKQGKQRVLAVRHHGRRPWRRRRLPSGPPGSGSLHHWSGKLYRPPGHRQIHHLHYHDDLLHHPLLCVRVRYKVNGQNGITAAVYLLSALRIALCFFPQNAWLSAMRRFPGAFTGTFPLRFWAC